MSRTPLPFERTDTGICTITLEQAERPFVVLDRGFLHRLNATLDAIGTVSGLVITSSSERVFVAGADLNEIRSLEDGELHEYLSFGAHVFGRISSLECTTVAAISGSALGGGLEFALHCDVLVGLMPAPDAKTYQIGLPEAGLGLCPGWGGTNTLPARIDPADAILRTCTGQPMTAEQAHKSGLFELISHSRQSLMDRAIARAKQKKQRTGETSPRNISDPDCKQSVIEAMETVRGDLPDTPAARAVIDCIRAGLDDGWKAGCARERDQLVKLRHTPQAQEALEAFFARSKARA